MSNPYEPCGECHLQPGETCDICGARASKYEAVVTPPYGYLTASRLAHEIEHSRQEEYDCESYDDFGKRFGLSGEGIRLICKGKRPPTADMLKRFGLEKVVLYRRVTAQGSPENVGMVEESECA